MYMYAVQMQAYWCWLMRYMYVYTSTVWDVKMITI